MQFVHFQVSEQIDNDILNAIPAKGTKEDIEKVLKEISQNIKMPYEYSNYRSLARHLVETILIQQTCNYECVYFATPEFITDKSLYVDYYRVISILSDKFILINS